jgi:hypothetical protein
MIVRLCVGLITACLVICCFAGCAKGPEPTYSLDYKAGFDPESEMQEIGYGVFLVTDDIDDRSVVIVVGWDSVTGHWPDIRVRSGYTDGEPDRIYVEEEGQERRVFLQPQGEITGRFLLSDRSMLFFLTHRPEGVIVTETGETISIPLPMDGRVYIYGPEGRLHETAAYARELREVIQMQGVRLRDNEAWVEGVLPVAREHLWVMEGLD